MIKQQVNVQYFRLAVGEAGGGRWCNLMMQWIVTFERIYIRIRRMGAMLRRLQHSQDLHDLIGTSDGLLSCDMCGSFETVPGK
jgi:hypothetical protein